MASTIDVCFLSYELPPMIGGEATYTYGLSKGISELGHSVTVITSDMGGRINLPEYSKNNLRVRYVTPIRHKPFRLFSFDIHAKKILYELYKKEDIDILHQTYDYYSTTVSRTEIKVPIVATIHHPFIMERKAVRAFASRIDYLKYRVHQPNFFLEKVQKKLCEKADKLIAVSEFTKHSIMEGYGIPSEKIEVIPNGVNKDAFSSHVNGREMRKKWSLLTEPIVLFVGRLDHNKGIGYLIKSFSKVVNDIPDAKLLIVGDGPLKNRISELIKIFNLQKSVILLGRVTDKDLPKIYAASDIVVLPSFMEGFGIVLLEAMASGKPCVATKAGGTEDVVLNRKTGILVPPADSTSLYQGIYTLLTDKELSQSMGKECRKKVEEKFTWDIISKRTISLYKEML